MVNRPSVPEIITVNSEELQSQIRDLLPSQNGFGSELQATNVITPIIDLTSAAEGSGLPYNLQTAIAFGSNETFAVAGATTLIINSPGFYRVVGTSCIEEGGPQHFTKIIMSDGLSTKDVWAHFVPGSGTPSAVTTASYDLVFWLRPGETISIGTNTGQATMAGSHRQLATGDGTLVQPVGFPL